jgi:transposase
MLGAPLLGIDLGLKQLAAFSDEAVENIEAPQFYRDLEPALAQAGHGKSVLDAGWGMLRTQLRYKCHWAGVRFEEIEEAYSTYSTQTCSACHSRTGPLGREGLGMREWVCRVCGSHHDRDRNAALNILAAGRRRLAEGILAPTA